MLAGPALLTETLVLVDVVDARAVHARVRLALVNLCSSKNNSVTCCVAVSVTCGVAVVICSVTCSLVSQVVSHVVSPVVSLVLSLVVSHVVSLVV